MQALSILSILLSEEALAGLTSNARRNRRAGAMRRVISGRALRLNALCGSHRRRRFGPIGGSPGNGP